jgi:hypothetical protein
MSSITSFTLNSCLSYQSDHVGKLSDATWSDWYDRQEFKVDEVMDDIGSKEAAAAAAAAAALAAVVGIVEFEVVEGEGEGIAPAVVVSLDTTTATAAIAVDGRGFSLIFLILDLRSPELIGISIL